MNLHAKRYPENFSPKNDGRVPVVILPGLFGSTTNWRSFAKKLSDHRPTIVVDQRNHGDSPHADSHSYHDMVDDLLKFISAEGLQKIELCGHSMGGKVAMVFSLLYPERVNSLTVLDIAPVEYSHTHAPYIKALMSLDLDLLESRSSADKALLGSIPDTPTRLFLLQSLYGNRGNFAWKLNLPVLLKDMPKILGFPFSELHGLQNTRETLFVGGEKSDYLVESMHNQVFKFFPSAKFETIENAGHWLHAEQPHAVLEVLLNFLRFRKK